MSKLERGEFSYGYDDVVGLHFVRWNDNSVVTTLSNCIGPYTLDRVERFSRNEKKWIPVARPNLIKVYNSAMGGVDLLDSAVGTYHTKIKGEKWWWPHFFCSSRVRTFREGCDVAPCIKEHFKTFHTRK